MKKRWNLVRSLALRTVAARSRVNAELQTGLPLCHFGASWPFQPKRRKLLQSVKNMLSFPPYGYPKEKCILPSCS